MNRSERRGAGGALSKFAHAAQTAALCLALAVLAPSAASAHAYLSHAVPAAGATVTVAPAALELRFTENVVLALANIRVAGAGGLVAAAKPAGEGKTLRVHLDKPLAPGTYVVTWRVVAVDTHPTSGSYKFIVKP